MAIEVTKPQEAKDETLKVSVLEMAQGAIMEACNVEVGKVMDNIFDLNTDAKKKREVTIKLSFTPSADRQQVNISAQATCKLQPNNAIETALYCCTAVRIMSAEKYRRSSLCRIFRDS